MLNIQYKKIAIDGLSIFYREAGNPQHPTLLLLHGFPSSSHMYRDLIRNLADRYHLVAPDYPGFGLSDMPARNAFAYTFDNLSVVIEKFIDALKLTHFTVYMQDYGAPVGYRVALRRPELIQALVLQNGNAYEEGLGPAIDDGKKFWANRNAETENAMRGALTLEGTTFQYLHGTEDASRINPNAYHHDQYFLDRPGNAEIQLDLLYDYRNNLTLYPAWQQFLRDRQPPALIAWGKNDPFFTDKGALAYLRDLPNAEVHLLNTGHFALEEFHEQIADYIDAFLRKHNIV
ncbi:alpha/beta fold hydrolase [Chryseolinea lacunae]|uniref:Alpha/beta hydrolase n=1 Tax=Chryseolinea lacunae TaxID=2801331 RepID=A0ABS1KVS2_9BACT|nr:alpha/beta hydrolase [Chryseolinea lacunae]MBL0743568.1 alpha/beta hydrolase [Chryseolinea lacunae]